MMNSLSIEELQIQGRAGNEEAILELGRRALDMDFCFSDSEYCVHKIEMAELKSELDREVPPSCPKCDHWLTTV